MDRRLRSRVHRATLEGNHAEVRSDVDDLAAALRNHHLRGSLTCKEHALHRRAHRLVVFLLRDVERGAGAGPSGVVDEDIDPPERLLGLVDHRADLSHIAHVGLHDDRFTSQGFDLALNVFYIFLATTGMLRQYDMRPRLGQSESDGPANAL